MPQYMPLRHLISSALGFAPGVMDTLDFQGLIFQLTNLMGLSQVTLGYSRATHTHTCENPYPLPRVGVLVGVLVGQGKGFHKTQGYTNPCVGTTLKLTRKPRNDIVNVK